ncbi:MarR family winged helix-turn-helix transcriptional regulator [Streptantibioticus silvisoli]|uniref:MarR family transcriptional regulator n=1 Tax=Streptantibioticus silvisoli TaxID=2705255 RepID=A0ABT6W8I7_9ACTN|nr:MarR family transcriptional regulator [Streptantibioticus silvisoli]MDI5967064.1 MarR family transcriptional regulator [Streptantibioticus silvisoli]
MSGHDDAARIAATFGSLLLRTNRSHLYRVLVGDAAGVDETTYPVLSGLARLGTATASELAQQIGLDRTVTTRYASRLEQAGLLTRRAHPTDARSTSLALTDLGEQTVRGMRERLLGLIDGATADWSDDERATFTRLFDRLAAALTTPDA